MPAVAKAALATKATLPLEVIGVIAEGKGAERKFAAVKLTLEGDRVVAVTVIERSAYLDIARDAARRGLWELKVAPDPDVLVHARPASADGSGLMPCCKRAFDPRADRMSSEANEVTCKGAK